MLAAKPVHPGACELAQRPGLRRGQQVQAGAEAAGLQAELRRRQRAVGLPGRIGGQRHRALQERRRCGEAAAGLRLPGRGLQLDGDLLVGGGGGLAPMPRPAIRIGDPVGRLGQRRVRRPPLPQGGGLVGRGAGQRVPEPDPAAELDQVRLRRGLSGLDRDTQPPRGPPDQRPVTGWIGRRQQHQPPGLGRQGRQPTGEGGLDQAGRRRGARQPEPARQLGRAQPLR